jgi:hypothetical protein
MIPGPPGLPGKPGKDGPEGDEGIFTYSNEVVHYYTTPDGDAPSYDAPFILGANETTPLSGSYLQYNPNGNLLVGEGLSSPSGSLSVISGNSNINKGDNNLMCGENNSESGDDNVFFGISNTDNEVYNSLIGGDSNSNIKGSNNMIYGEDNSTDSSVANSLLGGYNNTLNNSNTAILASDNCTVNESESAIIGSTGITLNRDTTTYVSNFENIGGYVSKYTIPKSGDVTASSDEYLYIINVNESDTINLEAGSQDLHGIRHRFVLLSDSGDMNDTMVIKPSGDDIIFDFSFNSAGLVSIPNKDYGAVEVQYSHPDGWYITDVSYRI